MMGETRTATTLLERAEHHIYLAAGYILVVGAAGLLVVAVIEVIEKALAGNYAGAIINLLDRVLLAMMIAEIIYTVGRIARTQQLEIEPFLIVGIIAAIRRLLVITAEGVGHVTLADPMFQGILAELALLTFVIFMLAWAMRLLRGQPPEPGSA